MGFDKAPSSWIPSWAEDGTNVTFPIASVPELTADEADGATGDIRRVLFALLEKLWAVWAATETADQPTKMTLYRSTTTNDLTGAMQRVFTARFDVEVTAQDVEDEPA